MFGSLKKKLQDALAKVTGKIETSEQREQEPVSAKHETGRRELSERVSEPAVERLEHEIEEHIEELEEIGKKVHEEHTQSQAEPREEKQAFEEEASKAAAQERELAAKRAERARESEKEFEKAAERPLLEQKIEEIFPETPKPVEEIKKPAFRGLFKRPVKPSETVEVPKEKRGLLKKIVEKTLSESDIEVILKELEVALLENDVAVEVAERIGEDVKAALLGRSITRGKTEEVIRTALRSAILDILEQETIDLEQRIKEKDGPFLITVVGFNGCGKTTTVAKLANRLKQFKPVLAAGDTFRAASIEQLEEHSRRLGVEVVKHRYGADSAAVIFDAVKHARAVGSKLVLADTAGRSHANTNLMDELKKVIRVNKPDLKILVLDSLAGNDIYDQARLFDGAVGVDAIILTKADVYERGGAALSAAYTLKKPILFLGVGQEYNDLQVFNPHKIVENLLG